MKYISTRGGVSAVESAEAIARGIAPDGGLYMPEAIPKTDIAYLSVIAKNGGYKALAAEILSLYLTDYTKEELLQIARDSYSSDKFPGGEVKVTKASKTVSVLELYHGPTCAFKDMALQIMPRLLVAALRKTGETRTAHILVATSGDTGKAALDGFKDVPGTKITVFYPSDGVSDIQKLQMCTQEGGNVRVCGVNGNFDDCQNGVKAVFADDEIRAEANGKGEFFSSANSINFGRLVPQIVYYFFAYFEMAKQGTISFGEKINVAVPTGNFGNILAGYMAKQMGLPIEKFICASNINNVLTDFFANGEYNANRTFHATMSPSMDILISSNLERLLYLISGAGETKKLMESLKKDGKYKIGDETLKILQTDFTGTRTDEDDTSGTLKAVNKNTGCLIDTHTAVAYSGAYKYGAKQQMLVVSTASAYKFASDVLKSITGEKVQDGFEAMDKLAIATNTVIPIALGELKSKKARFSETINADEIKRYVLK
ncbi:threonine synthase [Clostridia bacterium]|nr:threonine synthase [Clostridia bacterium]